MKSIIIWICIILFSVTTIDVKSMSKDTFKITVYESSQKFKALDSMAVNALGVGNIESDYMIEIKKVINAASGKKIKDSKFIWCIKYKNDFYVNLGYCDQIDMNSYYIKLDIVGHYCMTAMRKEIFKPQSAALEMGLVAGAVGVLAGSYHEIIYFERSEWRDTNNKKIPILLVDLSQKEYRNFSRHRNESALATLVTKDDVNKILKKNGIKISEPKTIIDVEAIIIEINKKYEKG